MSPSLMTTPPGAVNFLALMSTSSSSAPQTQVLPMPRAPTAAWLVLPPRLVRMPWAAIMPCRSSGLVSRRTRITFSPWAASSTARAESTTAFPAPAARLQVLQVLQRDGVPDPGHDVLALGFLQVVTVDALGAGTRVPGERHAG